MSENYVQGPAPIPEGQGLINKALSAGYSMQEVTDWKNQMTQQAIRHGYKPDEISNYWGESEPQTGELDRYHAANLEGVPHTEASQVADNPLKAMAAGWGMSVPGLLANGGKPGYVMPEHAGIVGTMLSSATQMVADLPISLTGMALGAAAGTAAGAAVPGANLTGASEAVGGVIGAGAGFNALPQAMREILLDTYNRGEVHTFRDFLGMTGKSLLTVGKSALEGAIAAPLGGMAGKIARDMAGNALGKGADAVVQALTYTAVGGALEGKVPDAQDFTAAAVLAVGFHIAASKVAAARGELSLTKAGEVAAQNVQHIYRDLGIAPADVLSLAENNPALRDVLFTQDVQGKPAVDAFRQYAKDEPAPFAPPPEVTAEGIRDRQITDPSWQMRDLPADKPMYTLLDSGQTIPNKELIGSYLEKFANAIGIKIRIGPPGDDAFFQTTQSAPGVFKYRNIYLAKNSYEQELAYTGLNPIQVFWHEAGHALDQHLGFGFGSGQSAGDNWKVKGGIDPDLLAEMKQSSATFAPRLTKENPRYRARPQELMADNIAAWISDPTLRKNMPIFGAKYGKALEPYLAIAEKTMPTKKNGAWQAPPPEENVGTTEGGGGAKGPPEPPIPQEGPDWKPFEPPPKLEGPQRPQLTPEELNEKMAEEAYGDRPARKSWPSVADIWRGWVTELNPAKQIDGILMQEPNWKFNPKQQMLIEDMFRQTYASRTRADDIINNGGIRVEGDGFARATYREVQADGSTIEKPVPSFKDAAEAVKADGGTQRDWENWMTASRAVDKMKLGYDLKVGDRSLEDLQRIVEAGAEKYGRGTTMLQRLFDSVLDYGRDSGVFSEAQIAGMRRDNPIYITFRYLMGDTSIRPAKGRGFKVSDPVHHFEGGEDRMLHPLEGAMDNIHQIVRMADRNRAVGSIAALATDKLKALGIKALPKPDVKATVAGPDSEIFKPYLVQDLTSYEPFLAYRAFRKDTNPNRFMYLDGGQPKLFVADSEALAKLIRGADTPGEMNTVLEVGAKLASLQRMGLVTTPDWSLKAIWRDQITTFVLDPLHPPPFVTWIGGFMDVMTKSPAYHEWVRNGGAGVSLQELDKTYVMKDFQKIFNETGTAARVWNVVKHPLELAQLINERMDAMSRVGYYNRAKDKGYSPLKAATMTRKAYLDYAERGTLAASQTMARLVPFFRSNLLGLKQGWEAVSERPMETALYAIGAVTIPTMALYAANYIADQYLPEAEKYSNLPRWQKDNFYITPQIGGMRFRMQLPQNVGVPFGGFVVRMLDHFKENDPRAFDGWATSLLNSLVPPLVPAALVPPMEEWQNKSYFTGRPLIPGSLEGASGPLQYTENTTELAKKAARAIKMAGGDMSSIMMENYVRNYTGNMGMYLLKALNAPFNESHKPLEPADYPFISSFLIRNPGSSAEPIQNFFTDRDELHTKAKDMRLAMSRRMQGSGSDAEIETAVQNALPTAPLDTVANDIQAMRSSLIEINNRPNISKKDYEKLSPQQRATQEGMTVDEKRQLTDDIYSEMIEVAKMGSKMAQQMNEQLKAMQQ